MAELKMLEIMLKLSKYILIAPPDKETSRTAVLQDILQAWENNQEVYVITDDSITLDQSVSTNRSSGDRDKNEADDNPPEVNTGLGDVSQDGRRLSDISRRSVSSQPLTKLLHCMRCGHNYQAMGSNKDCPKCTPKKNNRNLQRKGDFSSEERPSPGVRVDTVPLSDDIPADFRQYSHQTGNEKDRSPMPNQRKSAPHTMQKGRSEGSPQITEGGAGGTFFPKRTAGQAGQLVKHHTNKATPARVPPRPNLYLCNMCNEAFSSAARLHHHKILTHITATSPNIPRGRGAKQHSAPRKHITRNTQQKSKYMGQCPHCDNWFDKKSVFIDHFRIHTGEKPFHCEQCNKKFRTKAYLRNHMKKHHEVPSTTQTTEQSQSSSVNTQPGNDPSGGVQVTINVPKN